MSTPMSLIAHGSYVSDGAARTLEFPQPVDYFMIKNRSTWGTNPSAVVQSEYFNGYAAGQAKTMTEGGTGALSATLVAAGGAGFTAIDQSTFSDGAAVAVTAVTAANPAVVSTATTPVAGNIIRMINPTGMLQIGGLEFTVGTVVPATSFQLANLDASGFAAAATGGSWRLVNDPRYLPRRRWITGITAANPAVITTSIDHGYAVGSRITIHVPADFGMSEMEGLTATVTAVTASTITTDIDASGFTAFAYPTSAVAGAGVSFPHIVPFGEVSTILTQATDNVSFFGLQLGTSVVGANTNVMDWIAFARDYTV